MSLRSVLSRARMRSSSAPAGWEYPTTSEQRIAAIFRVSLMALPSARRSDLAQGTGRSRPIYDREPNPDGALKPGVYCSVDLHIPRKSPSLSVPADALIFNHNGMQVAIVTEGKAEIRKVTVKRDLGNRVEVDTGIRAGDQVIINPPVNLIDGGKVKVRLEGVAARR